jgi:cysteine desulfurase
MRRRIYLDYNATTPVAPEVLEAMLPFLRDRFGNASSVHWEGQVAKQAVDDAREAVAAFLGVEPREIVFTSGGTEADNLAVQGIARQYAWRGRHVLVSAIEHPAVLEAAKALRHEGFDVETIPVTADGVVDLDRFQEMLRPDTILVSVMAANNETGVIQPVEAIGAVCREREIYFHVDAVQAVGKIPVEPRRWGCDLLSLSAHKIYGPKGVGALYVRQGVDLTPILYGGFQERGRRSGTENVPGIVGLGAACRYIAERWMAEAERLAELRDRWEAELRREWPDVWVHGQRAPRVPNTSMFSLPGTDGEALLIRLDLEGVAVSTGSACSSGRLEPSHVLQAMGVPPEVVRGSIRVSLGRDTTWDDLATLLGVLREVVGAVGG